MGNPNRIMRQMREWQLTNKPGKTAFEQTYDYDDDDATMKRELMHWVQCRPDGTVIAFSRFKDRYVFRLLDRDTDKIRKWKIPLGEQL